MFKQNHQNDQQYTKEYKNLPPNFTQMVDALLAPQDQKWHDRWVFRNNFTASNTEQKFLHPHHRHHHRHHRCSSFFTVSLESFLLIYWSDAENRYCVTIPLFFFSCGVLLPLLLPLELMLWSWTRYWSSGCGCSAMGWCSFVTSREYSPDEPQPERPERPPLNWHGQARNFLTNNLLVNWGFHVERWGPKDMLGTVGERVVGVCGIVTGIDAKCGRHLIFY